MFSMTSRLEVDSVYLEFGDRRILSDIYMLFETGKITGILGRNGAGKSCLLKIIFGSLKAQYSNVRYNGETLFSAYRYDDKIKYLPQFNIFPGSGLRKSQPKWVVAAELSETARLYARCAARVEPEWIEAAAGSLVTLNSGKTIRLVGGLDAYYAPNAGGFTTMRNVLKVRSGRLNVKGGFKVKP